MLDLYQETLLVSALPCCGCLPSAVPVEVLLPCLIHVMVSQAGLVGVASCLLSNCVNDNLTCKGMFQELMTVQASDKRD